MKRRGFFSAFFCASLAAALLGAFGCNNNQEASGGDGGTSMAGGPPAAQQGGGNKLVIAWAEWEPAKQLEKLAADFTKETGIPVEVQQIPWSDFENKIKLAWTGQDPSYDLIVGDSQWLGKAATQGHYVELSDWAKDNVPMSDIAPSALKYYGEYPANSGKIYALPCMSDATVFAYRKDLFDDPNEKNAFRAKYGRELSPPETWNDFKDIAEFFTRKDKGLHGAALFYSREYDGATMGFDQVLWSYGGRLSEGKKVQGIINHPVAVDALQFYVDLKKFTPPGSENYYFAECLRDFQEGKVAMAQNWFAFLPDLTDPKKNKHAAHTAYFMIPRGPEGRYVSLGGQGISISSYSKNQDNAKKFIEWFHKPETQSKWVALGGLTANQKIAATDEFKKATPYNATFAESVPYLRDYYNTPNYSELLNVSQKNLNEAIAGSKKPKEALDTIAAEQQKIMDSGS